MSIREKGALHDCTEHVGNSWNRVARIETNLTKSHGVSFTENLELVRLAPLTGCARVAPACELANIIFYAEYGRQEGKGGGGVCESLSFTHQYHRQAQENEIPKESPRGRTIRPSHQFRASRPRRWKSFHPSSGLDPCTCPPLPCPALIPFTAIRFSNLYFPL